MRVWVATWLFLSVSFVLNVSVAACQSRKPNVSQRILTDKIMTDREQIEALYGKCTRQW